MKDYIYGILHLLKYYSFYLFKQIVILAEKVSNTPIKGLIQTI